MSFLSLAVTVGVTLTELFQAIAAVESCHGFDTDNETYLGKYQISYEYWKDSKMSGKWQDVQNDAYAEETMHNYFRRYASAAYSTKDFQTLARIHNGGPLGAQKVETRAYWLQVKEFLDDPNKRCN